MALCDYRWAAGVWHDHQLSTGCPKEERRERHVEDRRLRLPLDGKRRTSQGQFALLRHDRISIAIDCDAKRLTKVRCHGVPVSIAVNATAGEPAAEQERVCRVRMIARERQASPLGYRSGQVPTV